MGTREVWCAVAVIMIVFLIFGLNFSCVLIFIGRLSQILFPPRGLLLSLMIFWRACFFPTKRARN
jgi:hypothetical protein